MGTAVRDVILSLELSPVFWQDIPYIRIEFNRESLYTGNLCQDRKFEWTLPAVDSNRLSIWMINKTDADCHDGKDKAVIIQRIGIENFYYESFMRASRYRPEYSAGYHNFARSQNITVDPEIHSNYLGFNGEWFLEFTWPTFTWIHKLETNNQGWIYEKNI
jgi:hypothetical protein